MLVVSGSRVSFHFVGSREKAPVSVRAQGATFEVEGARVKRPAETSMIVLGCQAAACLIAPPAFLATSGPGNTRLPVFPILASYPVLGSREIHLHGYKAYRYSRSRSPSFRTP